jgi:hypothetical protein
LSGGISSLITGGAGATVGSLTADIPGFADLSKDYGAAGSAIQRAVNTGLTAGLLGKDVEASTLNSIIGSVTRTAGDYLKDGIKDISGTVRYAYDSLTNTGNAVDKNLADQKAAADAYNTLQADLSKKYDATQAAIKDFNDAKAAFDNNGQTQALADVANAKAKVANDLITSYNTAYNDGSEKLTGYKATLDDLKTKQTTLETDFVNQKKTLDTALADYTTQEKANAEYVSKVLNDTLTAKNDVESALGTKLTDDQIAAFVKTGDVQTAAKDYIDLKTTDLAEAQAAALKEGYYFDPNDKELAAQFLGVKDEKDTLDALQKFADARATTSEEATALYRQSYADIYGSDAEIPDPTPEQLAAFLPQIPTDVANVPKGYQGVAEDVVKSRMQDQFSQDKGFENYADLGEARTEFGTANPDAEEWKNYGTTGGVLDTGGVSQVAAKGGQGAVDFIDPQQYAQFQADQNAPDFVGPTLEDLGITPTQQVAQGPTQAEEPPAPTQFGFDQQASVDNLFGAPTGEDLGTQTAGAEVPTDLSLGNPEFDKQVAGFNPQDYMLGTQNKLDETAPGVQTAAYTPLTTMTDSGAPTDVGLRSLLTQQEGGTSAESAKDKGIGTLTEKTLADDQSQQDQAQTPDTKVSESTLTTGAPAGTITSQVLGENADQDVPAGTLTSKYFSDEKKGTENDDSLTGKSPASEFTYSSPRPTDEILRGSTTSPNRDSLDSFLAPLRTESTALTTSQDTPQTNAATQLGTNTQGTKMDDEFDPNADSNPDLNGEPGGGGGGGTSRFGEGMNLRFNKNDVEAGYDPLKEIQKEYERYLRSQNPDYQVPDYGVQDLGISQQNIDEFNQNFNPAGGFSSQWQTVGSDRVMVNDDGTGIGINTETGEQYALTPAQVQSLINNGLLNTKGSGYVAATGGTGNLPGGTPKPPGGTTKTTGGTGSKVVDKVIDKLTNYATSDRGLAAIAGALAGPAIAPKGIDPMGLRGIQAGSGKQLVQTGAKGTGGKGGVRYFEKKAGGGTVGGLGYLKSAHDGMADKINATIDNKRPAKLSGGEFVIPADVVSHLGNGNSEAGAKQLYDLMERVRKARTGTPEQGKQINPKKYLPR